MYNVLRIIMLAKLFLPHNVNYVTAARERKPVELFSHNQTAYKNALAMMAQTGKAAVIHPTGAGANRKTAVS